MKKICILAALLCSTVFNAPAQEKNEISVGYGTVPNSSLLSMFTGLTVISSSLGTVKYTDWKCTGAFSAEYFHRVSPRFSVGGAAVYVRSSRDILILKNIEGEAKVNFFTLMPSVKYEWLQKKDISLYSKAAAGITLRSEKQSCTGADEFTGNDIFPNVQVSLLRVEAGGLSLRGFAEIGYGEQGMVMAGLRYRF